MAYFTSTASSGAHEVTLKFGYISVKPTIMELETAQTTENDNTFKFSLTADEVAQGDAYKTLRLENTTEMKTQNYYIRIKFAFYNDTELSDLATIGIAESSDYWVNTNSAYKTDIGPFLSNNWTKGSDEKYYCQKEIILNNENGSILSQYIPLHIHFSNKLNADNLNNAFVYMEIEAIQSANNGYEEWSSTAPSGWPTNLFRSTIPSEYTQLQYIEATGSQYIVTDFYVDNTVTDYAIETCVKWSENPTNTRQLMGYTTSGAGYWGNNNGYYELRGVTTVPASTTSFDTVKVARVDSAYKLYVNNSLHATRIVDDNSGTYMIFCLSRASVYYNCSQMSCVKIYKNSNLVYNLVPVKNAEGVAGFFDTINQKFYQSGTSTALVAGPNA